MADLDVTATHRQGYVPGVAALAAAAERAEQLTTPQVVADLAALADDIGGATPDQVADRRALLYEAARRLSRADDA